MSHGPMVNLKRWGGGVQRFHHAESCQTCWEQSTRRPEEEHNTFLCMLTVLQWWFKGSWKQGSFTNKQNISLKHVCCLKIVKKKRYPWLWFTRCSLDDRLQCQTTTPLTVFMNQQTICLRLCKLDTPAGWVGLFVLHLWGQAFISKKQVWHMS